MEDRGSQNGDEEDGDQAPSTCNGDRIPIDGLDEDSSQRPKQCGQE